MPLVVSDIEGALGSELIPATMSTRSGRSSGSPPVRRTSVTPAETAIATIRTSSSADSRSGLGSQATPSAGMQYVHRRLQRSITDTRKSVWIRP